MAEKRSGLDEILVRWRDEIKKKQRRIISFEETVEIKINSLKRWIFAETAPLEGWQCRQFHYTRKREREFIDSDWRPIRVGETWGGPDLSALFRCQGTMPLRFRGHKVALKIYFGGDGLLWLNGKPYHGLDPFRDTVILTCAARGDEVFDFEVESYIFWHFGEPEVKTFECSHFAVMDQEMNDIYWDFRAAYNVMVVPDQDPDLAEFLKAGMAKACAPIDQNETDLRKVKENALAAGKILHREIYQTDRFKKPGLMHLCGNSHLDVVFLWTHAEFVRKLGRTHASTLRLMEQYPDYLFAQSQPLMYEEMKSSYPALYEEVKERIRQGRWEVIGSFWVEPDCNLISGESFVRQILYGVQFIEKEFGITPRTCWCPDVFGNVWTMPQILVRSGLKYFVTHKMAVWNDTNPWTKNTFWWQGPDGSRILSLVPPTHFIGTIEPDHLAQHWEKFSDKGTIGESLYNFGWGDGGGGPDPEMLEYQKRYQDFPGVTPTKPSLIERALESIHQKALKTNLPIWNDELYLEEHRGTFTTKARLKKLNRICEILYREAELFSCFSGMPYPSDNLRSGWKELLNNQFHDSLPGSHIPAVYLDLQDSYAKALQIGEETRLDALLALEQQIDTRGDGQALLVFNSLSFERNSTLHLPMPESPLQILDPKGNEIPHQFIRHQETGQSVLAFQAEHVPPAGYQVFRMVQNEGKHFSGNIRVTEASLENDFLRVALNGGGELLSLVDKNTGREFIDPARKGNVLMLYEDVPGKYEAWDIAPSHTNVSFELGAASLEVVERGPVRAALELRRTFRNSRLIQRIVLSANSPRLDFETWVDWREQQKLLKVRFFTTLQTRTATYDIPFGNIERSAYRNNSFDEAKFEVPGHWWMDLSQPDCGLSLLNTCKYGHEAFDGMMALTLLRGPISPDPQSDQEEHRFTYSLFPHAGSWREGKTHQAAADLNVPCLPLLADSHPGILPARNSFLSLDAENVMLEALKKAEDSDHLVVRLVERWGMRNKVRVELQSPLAELLECNLMEREDVPISFNGTEFQFEIGPYEIRTFKIRVDRRN
jgi:alpha-mannosidase